MSARSRSMMRSVVVHEVLCAPPNDATSGWFTSSASSNR